MTGTAKLVMALFYVLFTGLFLLAFARHYEPSALMVGRWLGLYVVSMVMPLWWTIALGRTLSARGIELSQHQLVMPAWCAAATALLAINLLR